MADVLIKTTTTYQEVSYSIDQCLIPEEPEFQPVSADIVHRGYQLDQIISGRAHLSEKAPAIELDPNFCADGIDDDCSDSEKAELAWLDASSKNKVEIMTLTDFAVEALVGIASIPLIPLAFISGCEEVSEESQVLQRELQRGQKKSDGVCIQEYTPKRGNIIYITTHCPIILF